MSGTVKWLCVSYEGQEIARSRRAVSMWERFRGLMLAPPLPPGEALWLPECAAVHTAFLRASIDLLFLRGWQVVRVCRRVAPWRIVVCSDADSVVELAAGETERLGLSTGTRLQFGFVRTTERRPA